MVGSTTAPGGPSTHTLSFQYYYIDNFYGMCYKPLINMWSTK